MKKVILNIALIAVSASLVLTSCKKKDEVEPDYSELSQQSGDNASVQRESDQAINDAITLLEGSSLSGARLSKAAPSTSSLDSNECKVDTMMVDGKKHFQFKYKGISKDGKVRSGKMTAVLTSGTSWKDEGAVLTLTFDTIKVNRNGKSVTFSGTKIITNVTGGKVKDLVSSTDSIVHNVSSSNLKITFDDGTTRTWVVSKSRTFKGDGTCTIKGTGLDGISESGITRKGTPFKTTIKKPVIFSKCNGNDPKPISGQEVHTGLVREVAVTLGVDDAGTEVNSCESTGMKIVWLNRKGETQQVIIKY